MSEVLNIELRKIQLNDGSWLIYYDGSDLDLDCGVYYLDIVIGGEKWYSELFKIQEISTNSKPELIKDIFHTALRFYDNILKQNYYKYYNLCDIGVLNPINGIIPFIIDVSKIENLNINNIITYMICHDGTSQEDISGSIYWTYNSTLKVLYHDGRNTNQQFYCGVYYLEVNLTGAKRILYDVDFTLWESSSSLLFPSQPVGLNFTNDGNFVNISNDGNKLRLNITGMTNMISADKIQVSFSNYYELQPGDYEIVVNLEENTGSVNAFIPGVINTPLSIGVNTISFTLIIVNTLILDFFAIGTYLVSKFTLKQTSNVKFYSEHLRIQNVTNELIENLFLFTEIDTPGGFQEIITEEGQTIII